MKMRSIRFVQLLALGCILHSCQMNGHKISKQKIYSTLTPSINKDSSLFMFQFGIINLNTTKSIDSIRKATDTIKGLKGMELSVPDKRCIFYVDSFETHKSLMSAIESSGYKMEKTFEMKGPGLTCDIPAIDSDEDIKARIVKLNKSSIETVKSTFNKHKDKVRIMTIPNPACLACVNGQRFINSIFKDSFISNEEIFGLTIWTSIGGWGSYKDAEKLAPEIIDSRMSHFWDAQMRIGKQFKSTLGIAKTYKTAWDVYLIYEKGIIWESDPPKPTFWMHQLSEESGVDGKLALNKEVFMKELTNVLK